MKSTDSHPTSNPDPWASRDADVGLVHRVLAGSTPDWWEMVDRYSGLVVAVLRRHLPGVDADEIRTLYVDVFCHLRSGGLSSYEGRCSLASWLVLLSRNRARDHLRHHYGRIVVPRGVRRLPAADRRVYQLVYEEGLGFEEVRYRLNSEGVSLTTDDIVDAIHRIDGVIDRRALRRSAYNKEARLVGKISGRLLEFLDEARAEAEESSAQARPDSRLLQEELDQLRERVMNIVARLPEDDRAVVELRFGHDRTAPEIAQELGLNGQREAYTRISRAMRRIRRLLIRASPHGMPDA